MQDESEVQAVLHVKPDEVIVLALALAALAMAVKERRRISDFPSLPLLKWSYLVLLAGWIFTIFEDLFLRDAMNFIEHVCYAGSTVLLAVWCALVFARRSPGGES